MLEILEKSGQLTAATKQLLSPVKIVPETWRIRVEATDKRFIMTPEPTDPNESDLGDDAYRSLSSQWFSRIPYAKAEAGIRSVVAPRSDYTAIVASSMWGNRVVFRDEDSKVAWQNYIFRFLNSGKSARVQAEYWENKVIPEDAPKGCLAWPLMPHQRIAAYNALTLFGYGLLMEQGTGKTATAIAIMEEAVKRDLNEHQVNLIVVPANLLENWKEEIQKFSASKVYVEILRGTKLSRVKKLINCYSAVNNDGYDWSAAIISYDTISNAYAQLKHFNLGFIVADETQNIKNPSTARWKAMLQMRDRAERRLILTGTLLANSIVDAYTQMEFIDEGWSGFRSFTDFKKFHGRFREIEIQGHTIETCIGVQNVPLLQERFSRCSIRATKEQVLPDLPKKVRTLREVEMTAEQKRMYKQLATTLLLEVSASMDAKPSKITAQHCLTKLLKLNEITSGYMVADAVWDELAHTMKPRETFWFNPNPKLDMLDQVLDEMLGKNSKCVIWAHALPNIHAIYKRLKDRFRCATHYGATPREERERIKESFNHGDLQIFIANPATAGTGLTLLGNSDEDTAADLVIHYSQNWSSLERRQAEDRSHRIGTKRQVRHVDICVPGTIDMEIRDAVTDKVNMANQIQDVSETLSEVLKCLK